MSSAQLLKTTILQNAMLYRMANKPSHMIFAGSSGSTVKKFRTGKWMDTINACPNLQALITDKSDKNAVNDLHTQQNVDGIAATNDGCMKTRKHCMTSGRLFQKTS
ncbi:hypothetical protein KU15F68_47470 [Escherichia coli]